jgi:hypothetical protein
MRLAVMLSRRAL